MLRCTAIEGRPRCTVRRYSALRSRSRSPLRLSPSPFRCLGSWDTCLHILLHVGLSVTESRKEKDVLGTAGAQMQIVVRSRRPGRPTDRFLRMLQRLRRGQSVVGPNARKSLHAESGLGAVEVTRPSLPPFTNLHRFGLRNFPLSILFAERATDYFFPYPRFERLSLAKFHEYRAKGSKINS